jgi:hypothetical protein
MSRIVIVILIYHRHKPIDPKIYTVYVDSVHCIDASIAVSIPI